MEGNLNRIKSERLEYLLMAGIIIPVVFGSLLFSNETETALWMRRVSLVFILALSIYYILVSDKQLLHIAAFVCVAAAAACTLIVFKNESQVYIQAAPYVVSSVAVMRMCIRHSLAYKSLEVMEGLLSLFLLVAASRFFIEIEAVSNYYSFGVCFLIATLMYNSNMWERYASSEQNLLTLLLVVCLAEVIVISAKFI